MAIAKALATVWSARIKQALLDSLVFGSAAVSNREHEGEVGEYGSTVKIISVAPVTIKAYTKDTNIAAPDVLTDAETILNIDQAHYFNFMIDSIDAAQSRPKLMDEAARTAAWGLRDVADNFLATAILADTTNVVGTAGAPIPSASGGAWNILVDLAVKLDAANCPQEGRWAVVTPAFHGVLVKDDRFVHATGAGDEVLRNGRVGRAAGFNIFMSNNLSATRVAAGHPMGLTFAEQITDTVPYTPDLRFGDALKGLYVFGGKVVYGQCLANAHFS